MGKGGLFKFSLFSALGALAGYASYMATKDEFSDETKDKYGKVLNKVKNVGTDIKRTYTAIGDKESFKSATNSLGASTKKLAEKTGALVKSASTDMYKRAKVDIKNAYDRIVEDGEDYDDIDQSTVKKSAKKKSVKKAAKKPIKKTAVKKKVVKKKSTKKSK